MLKDSLNHISSIFSLDKVLNVSGGKNYIQKYYNDNKFAYSIIHDDDFLHMGLSEEGIFKKEDLKKPLTYIEEHITSGSNILELACGRGGNIEYLFRKYDSCSFTGLDLTNTQLKFARKRKLGDNVTFIQGDFHNLSCIDDESISIVYTIESLCYGNNKEQVFKEVNRVLQPGGKFIVVDGYANNTLEEYQQLSILLTAKGMAVDIIESYDDVVSYAKKMGLSVEKDYNFSEKVIPSMERLKRKTLFLGKRGWISKLIMKIIPSVISYNYISAYLMPDLMKEKVALYMITVFKK